MEPQPRRRMSINRLDGGNARARGRERSPRPGAAEREVDGPVAEARGLQLLADFVVPPRDILEENPTFSARLR